MVEMVMIDRWTTHFEHSSVNKSGTLFTALLCCDYDKFVRFRRKWKIYFTCESYVAFRHRSLACRRYRLWLLCSLEVVKVWGSNSRRVPDGADCYWPGRGTCCRVTYGSSATVRRRWLGQIAGWVGQPAVLSSQHDIQGQTSRTTARTPTHRQTDRIWRASVRRPVESDLLRGLTAWQ